MITIIVISLLAVTGTALTVYLRQRTPGVKPDSELAPPRFAGLFSSHAPSAASAETTADETSRLRANLLDRARDGDLTALSASRSTGDAELYKQVLDRMTESAADSRQKLRALTSFISGNHELRGNKRLAELVMADWEAAPDKRSTVEMIHMGALSDDAAIYQEAIELVISLWRKGKLVEFRPEDLIELFESQFWILAPEARQGGAGFALKRKLAGVRRELATTSPARS